MIACWLGCTHRETRRIGGSPGVFLRRRFDASLDEVWSACTARERLSRWFGKVSGDLHEGGVLTIDLATGPTSRVLRCDLPYHLVVTWSSAGDPLDLIQEVELRLSADGDGTVLELEHRFFDEPAGWFVVGAGWEEWIIRLRVGPRPGNPVEVTSEELYPQLEAQWMALGEPDPSELAPSVAKG